MICSPVAARRLAAFASATMGRKESSDCTADRGTAACAVALRMRLPDILAGIPMAHAKGKTKIAATAKTAATHDAANASRSNAKQDVSNGSWSELFSRTACVIAHWMGKPISFLIATALVITWALTGPLFAYSDTWQLVINTSTTIVTFLMVFLIQNTQNRDTMALQLKLSELILVISAAENRFANAEDLTEEELERLHKELQSRTQTALGVLDRRRSAQTKKAS
jgi:low affinity Fe/Cu permease